MSHRRSTVLALLLLMPLVTPGALSIYLHRTAYLAADSYTLSDIAAVPAGERAAAGDLLGLSLGSTPLRPTLLSAQSIGALLAGVGYTQVVLVGGRVALLPRRSVPAGSERFYEDLLSFIGESDAVPAGRLEVEVLESQTIPPAPGYSFLWSGQPARRALGAAGGGLAPLAGELLLSYRQAGLSQADAGSWTGSIRLWAHRYLPVAYTATSVPARSRMDNGKVTYRDEDVSLAAGAFLTKADGVEEFRSTLGLAAGTRIEPRHLERVLAVRAGEAVQVVFVRPGLRVSVPGRAAGSGGVGERVEVRLGAGGRRFEGLVAAGGEVRVESF